MKRFLDVWTKKDEVKELTVYWKCSNGKMMSAVRGKDGMYNVICTENNAVDMKSKTVTLLKQLNGNIKLVWKKA